MAYCPAHPPELVILSNILPPIFFYLLIVNLSPTIDHTSPLGNIATFLPYTLFKVNSHNFIYTFILLWGKKKPTSYSPSLTYPSVVRHNGSQHSLTVPFSNHSLRAPARYLLTTTPSPFLLHNSLYPLLDCPLTTPPAVHSFALFGVLPLRRAFACHHFEPLLE